MSNNGNNSGSNHGEKKPADGQSAPKPSSGGLYHQAGVKPSGTVERSANLPREYRIISPKRESR